GSPPPGGPTPPQQTPPTDIDIDEPDPRVNAPTFHPPTTVPAATPSPAISRVQVASLTIPTGISVPRELGQPAPVADGSSADSMPSGTPPKDTGPANELSQPVVRSGVTQTAAPQPQVAPPMAAPAASAASAAPAGPTPGAKRGPVANAVLKPGEIDLGPNRRKASGSGPGLGRILKWVGVGVVGLGALGGIAFLIYSLVIARNQAFFNMMAAELPEDTIGVLAAKSPKVMLELLGEEFPAELSKLAEADLGFDPFNAASYTEMGVDIEAPVAVALLSGEGTFSLSFGVHDREALKKSLSQRAKEALNLDEDLRWIERGYEDLPGMWLDEPAPVAVLWPDNRAIIVAGGHPDDVTRLAKAIAKASKGENLSTRPGFKGSSNSVARPWRRLMSMRRPHAPRCSARG
ncbi:MAG: hypothetical protein JKY37_11280, partial [Nannocystaceae bacterium]|nr:hypothetical protein [Nannocystaceae bacterium]